LRKNRGEKSLSEKLRSEGIEKLLSFALFSKGAISGGMSRHVKG